MLEEVQTVHRPQIAIVAVPKNTTVARYPTEVVLYDTNALSAHATVNGIRRGCGCAVYALTETCVAEVDGTCIVFRFSFIHIAVGTIDIH